MSAQPGGTRPGEAAQAPGAAVKGGITRATWRWFDENILELGRELRWSYLPPLMVYMAAGISGLTAVVGTFFVKDYLSLSAAALAALGFWTGIPWALKMPIGHLVDLIWRWKAWLVYLGAALLAASILIVVGLLENRAAMEAIMPANAWYILASILSPVGYVIQDTVADAMTVEAVPRVDHQGKPLPEAQRTLMHTTMQTLGRVAIIGGSVLVAFVSLYMLAGVQALPAAQKTIVYRNVYLAALSIPLISVLGIAVAALVRRRDRQRLMHQGVSEAKARELLEVREERPEPNWWILGGSLLFVVFTASVGLSDVPFSQEIIFAGSFAIVTFLLARLTRELDPVARETLVGTAIVIFVFRAMPSTGPGVSWWMIDVLGFDEEFFSVLNLIGSGLTLLGLFVFRRFMAGHSISYIVGMLTIVGAVLTLPYLGMYHGLHLWLERVSGGLVGARTIAFIDTALESPLGQVAMIPMLAWIAKSAPANLKATYFAVMASFTNLALSLAQLGTKYMNQVYVVTRAVKDPATGAIKTPADYSQLGELLIAVVVVATVLPFAAIGIARLARLRTA